MRTEDTSKRSLRNVSALTDKHQVTVVSQNIDGSNTASRKHQETVVSQTIDDSNTKGRKRIWQETEESQVSYKDGSGDGSETTMLTADETGSEKPSVQYN